MISDKDKPERVSGWVLAGVVFFHLLLLRAPAGILMTATIVLLAGAIMRARRIFVPAWLGRLLLLLGVVLAVALQMRTRPEGMLGSMAGLAGAIFLLRPVTPARGLKVLLGILMTLASLILRPESGVGVTFIVLDVVLLLILAEQIHRPPEAALSLWVSLMRSLRVVVPVGIVVTMIFWLFPNLSVFTPPALTGFSGGGVLNPGAIAGLQQSRRIALVARFSKAQALPRPADLYWRGQVLEVNEGLRWTRAGGRSGRSERLSSLRETALPDGEGWKYSQDVMSNRGGIVPVLDHAVLVEATRDGQDVAVFDIGAAVLTAVGTGPLTLEVVSTEERVADPPLAAIAQGGLNTPESLRANAEIREITGRILSPPLATTARLEGLGDFFRESGFTYTRWPGRMPDLAGFLLKQRRGFCEHYAAAAANLLRLGGVPARIVTGYRGGEWNPWLRTITVRDSAAHAWVEAWDSPSQRWLRFDPANFVAPELSARIQREMDSDHWPWHWLAMSYANAVVTTANDRLEGFLARVSSSEIWAYLPPVLAGLYTLAALGWLVRNHLKRRSAGAAEVAALLLEELEHAAARAHRQRRAGETPLAWLARLHRQAGHGSEGEALDLFAKGYESGVYRAAGADVSTDLRTAVRTLRRIWKTTPPGQAGEAGKTGYTPARA